MSVPANTLQAYVTVDAGADNLDFASRIAAMHLMCDNTQQFRGWVESTLTNLRIDLLGTASQTQPRFRSGSILDNLANSGNTVIVVQGYYNPIQHNLAHPLLVETEVRSQFPTACPNPEDTAHRLARGLNRAAWVTDQLNRSLQDITGDANQLLPASTYGPRVRFVQFEDRFSGHVQCVGSGSYVQTYGGGTLNPMDPRETFLDGDDCVHPSRSGVSQVADTVFRALRTRSDDISHVTGSPIALQE